MRSPVRQHAETEILHLSVLNEIYACNPPLRAQGFLCGRGDGRLEEPEGLGDTKETVSSRHDRADAHGNSESMSVCREPVQLQAKKKASAERGAWTWAPITNQEAIYN